MQASVRRNLLLALCGVLLFTRIVGVHQHLCFDGREPAVSVHVLDTGIEHQALPGQFTHDDQNVDDSGRTLVKSAHVNSAVEFFALLLVFTAVLPVIRRAWLVRPDERPVCSTPHFFRPPLRGPPLAVPC